MDYSSNWLRSGFLFFDSRQHIFMASPVVSHSCTSRFHGISIRRIAYFIELIQILSKAISSKYSLNLAGIFNSPFTTHH